MKPMLPLEDMDKRHAGLTPSVAGNYYEAACVSLSRNHAPPQDFDVIGDEAQLTAQVQWPPPDERRLRAWANRDDATRDGAYACAIAAVEVLSGLFAVSRAETLTGADYYVAPQGYEAEDLEHCIRLEVSGTHCDELEVRKRLSAKMKQARQGRSNLPAIAAVVGFKVRFIMLRSVNNDLA
jgi:hypothetical protein